MKRRKASHREVGLPTHAVWIDLGRWLGRSSLYSGSPNPRSQRLWRQTELLKQRAKA